MKRKPLSLERSLLLLLSYLVLHSSRHSTPTAPPPQRGCPPVYTAAHLHPFRCHTEPPQNSPGSASHLQDPREAGRAPFRVPGSLGRTGRSSRRQARGSKRPGSAFPASVRSGWRPWPADGGRTPGVPCALATRPALYAPGTGLPVPRRRFRRCHHRGETLLRGLVWRTRGRA